MSVEKAKEILKETTDLQRSDCPSDEQFLSSTRDALYKALAELEAESTPETGEFTKILRKLCEMKAAEASARFESIAGHVVELQGRGKQACCLIDSLQEQLTAKDKEIELLKAALGRLVEYTAQRLSPDEFIRLVQKAVEQSLKGPEREL